MCNSQNCPRINGFKVYHRPRSTGNRAAGGVVVAVQENIDSEEIELETDFEAVTIKISAPLNVNVLNIYLPPSMNIDNTELTSLINQIPKPFIVVGDFNAHHPLWGSDYVSIRGRSIVDFAEDNSLAVLNTGEPTYVDQRHGSFSCIDLALCSDDLAGTLEWSVLPDTYSSDHIPLNISFPGPCEIPQKSRPRWKIEEANWEQYQGTLNFERDDNIERQVEKITKSMLEAAEVSIPKTKGYPGKRSVPWWNAEIAELVKKRRKALRQLKANRQNQEQMESDFKNANAAAKDAIIRAKKKSWEELAETFSSQTPLREMWSNYQKIQGRKRRTQINSILYEGATVSDSAAICDLLGNAFQKVSSVSTYKDVFLNHKRAVESNTLFIPEDTGPHNQKFTRYELDEALEGLKGSSPGPDNVHYAMIKHLPPDGKVILLETYNRLWEESVYPQEWTKSYVVPIFKNKGLRSDPQNYRPIYLNSCIGKVLERMINNRLMHLLETRGLLFTHQYAFRKGRSTTDHLCTLEENIREAFNNNKVAQVAFLDVSKAYDTTWRRLCLDQLGNHNIGGRMLRYLEGMLRSRSFQVIANGKTSGTKIMETGLCQGSVLSVTMFLIAINTLINYLPSNVKCLIYADDVILVATGDNAKETEDKLQTACHQLELWQTKTGFQISAQKSASVVFRNPRHEKPKTGNKLTLNGTIMPRKDSYKCLGVTFDQHLKFRSHVEEVKAACQQRVLFIRSVAARTWGGDRNTLIKLYHATVVEKLLYAAPILSGIDDKVLKALDTVHNAGLRAIIGAFRTSPILSLQAETGIPSLKSLINQRTILYTIRRAAVECVEEMIAVEDTTSEDSGDSSSSDADVSSGERWGERIRSRSHPNSYRIRGQNMMNELDLSLPRATCFKIPVCPPWQRSKLHVDKSLHYKLSQGATANELRCMFNELKESEYRIHKMIFTDGSKQASKCGFGIVSEEFVFRKRLSNICSIFAAESEAVEQALLWIVDQQRPQAYLLCTDSMSVINNLEKCKINSRWKDSIQNLHNRITQVGAEIIFCWVPSHIGIPGNERADREAKRALDLPLAEQETVEFKEVRKVVKTQITHKWQMEWHRNLNNKLREVKNTVLPYKSVFSGKRRDDVILARLRIGHTLLTHAFLLDRVDCPLCPRCNESLTVKHIIVNCPQLEEERRKHGIPENLREALSDDSDMAEKVIKYLKTLQLYEKI